MLGESKVMKSVSGNTNRVCRHYIASQPRASAMTLFYSCGVQVKESPERDDVHMR